MALHLTVGAGLTTLVDPLAAVLSDVSGDLFAPDVVAVPGEGVRSWLTWQLSQRLGGPHGIVANIEWVFPATIGRRALGLTDRHDLWGVDTLTWAVATVLRDGALPEIRSHEVELGRARAIADLFDRYGLRRPGMVLAWERGHDVDALGRPLPEAHRWQPVLWRALAQHFGQPSSAALAFDRLARLRDEGPVGHVPDRFVVAGVTGLAWFQLEVLSALALHREVHLLAPVPSVDMWQRIAEVIRRQRIGGRPVEFSRADDPTAHVPRHQLMRSWGRATREAQCNVLGVLGGEHSVAAAPRADRPEPPITLLDHLQAGLRADLDEPTVRVEADDSVRWHRCHGPARQADVVRDALLHLFERRHSDGTPSFEPRDVAVLCTDVATFAPLLEAAFAGAPEDGVPPIPVRVADRTLGGEAPLFDVASGLVGLLEQRWRRDDLLDLARLPAVRRRFGFSAGDLGLVEQWLLSTGVRWGLTPEDHHRVGLPEDLRSNTVQSGLDQLFVGAAMRSGVTHGPGGVAPTGDLEGDDLALLGTFAAFVELVGAHVRVLSESTTVPTWITRLRAAVSDLARLADGEAWQWGSLDRELAVFSETARLADPSHTDPVVDAIQLAQLVVARLGARPGRARFDTGAVTVSSLAGQRGVPRRVVVLVGLDEGLMGSGVAASDDMVAAAPLVGDPDPRAEWRAQLLDAVLAARDHLVLVSTGFEVRTNEVVAPAVALAELVEAVDALVEGGSHGRTWVIDHPRQPWNPRALQPGALGEPGAWTFHRGAAALSASARLPRIVGAVLTGSLTRETGDLTLSELIRGVTRPVEALLRDRCGMALPSAGDDSPTVLPLDLDALEAWTMRDRMVSTVVSARDPAEAEAAMTLQLDLLRRRGLLPPLALGDAVADGLRTDISNLVAIARSLGAQLDLPGEVIDVDIVLDDLSPRRVTGRIPQIHGTQLVRLSASQFRLEQVLSAWVELVLLTVALPDRTWSAVVVGRDTTKAGAKGRTLALTSVEAAQEALSVVVDLVDRARCEVIPFDVDLSDALYRSGLDTLLTSWGAGRGASARRWIAWALADTELETLLEAPAWPDATDESWGGGGRLEQWAHRLWSAFDATVRSEDD